MRTCAQIKKESESLRVCARVRVTVGVRAHSRRGGRKGCTQADPGAECVCKSCVPASRSGVGPTPPWGLFGSLALHDLRVLSRARGDARPRRADSRRCQCAPPSRRLQDPAHAATNGRGCPPRPRPRTIFHAAHDSTVIPLPLPSPSPPSRTPAPRPVPRKRVAAESPGRGGRGTRPPARRAPPRPETPPAPPARPCRGPARRLPWAIDGVARRAGRCALTNNRSPRSTGDG